MPRCRPVSYTHLDVYKRQVPSGAVLKAFAFEGGNSEGTAKLLPREEARRIYDSIVAQTRDPALLEFVGNAVVKSSVFPVPANGTQKVRVTYEMCIRDSLPDASKIVIAIRPHRRIRRTMDWPTRVIVNHRLIIKIHHIQRSIRPHTVLNRPEPQILAANELRLLTPRFTMRLVGHPILLNDKMTDAVSYTHLDVYKRQK